MINLNLSLSKRAQRQAITTLGHTIESHELIEWRKTDHGRGKWVESKVEAVLIDGSWRNLDEAFQILYKPIIEEHFESF